MRSELLKESIEASARDGRLFHAYILESSEKDYLNSFAYDLANSITPYGEDVHIVCAEGMSIKDKAIESLLERLQLRPLVGERNIAIISDADTMTHRAQNRLLKTLEEPPGRSLLFILSANAENLLPTIRSRCVIFRLDRSQSLNNTPNETLKKYVDEIGYGILKRKNYYTFSDTVKEIVKDKDNIHVFLDELEKFFRDIFFCNIDISLVRDGQELKKYSDLTTEEKTFKVIDLIEEARRDLNRYVNPGYVIKNMILQMI